MMQLHIQYNRFISCMYDLLLYTVIILVHVLIDLVINNSTVACCIRDRTLDKVNIDFLLHLSFCKYHV